LAVRQIILSGGQFINAQWNEIARHGGAHAARRDAAKELFREIVRRAASGEVEGYCDL
jgi:hypothetical protein